VNRSKERCPGYGLGHNEIIMTRAGGRKIIYNSFDYIKKL
jgi:hypothetical protein